MPRTGLHRDNRSLSSARCCNDATHAVPPNFRHSYSTYNCCCLVVWQFWPDDVQRRCAIQPTSVELKDSSLLRRRELNNTNVEQRSVQTSCTHLWKRTTCIQHLATTIASNLANIQFSDDLVLSAKSWLNLVCFGNGPFSENLARSVSTRGARQRLDVARQRHMLPAGVRKELVQSRRRTGSTRLRINGHLWQPTLAAHQRQ